jgi:hypothetical protein
MSVTLTSLLTFHVTYRDATLEQALIETFLVPKLFLLYNVI